MNSRPYEATLRTLGASLDSDPARTLLALDELITEAILTGAREDQAQARVFSARANRLLSKWAVSAEHARLAIALAGSLEDPTLLQQALRELAQTLLYLSEFQEAHDSIDRCIALSCLGGIERARTLMVKGNILSQEGHHRQTVGVFRQALRLFSEAEFEAGIASALASLGGAHQKMGHYDRALDYQTRAYLLFRETRSNYNEVCALNNIGDIHLNRKAYTLAAHRLQEAHQLAIKYGFRRLIAGTGINLSIIEAVQGDMCLAQEKLAQAMRIGIELNAADILERATAVRYEYFPHLAPEAEETTVVETAVVAK